MPRLDGTEADARNIGFIENGADQIGKTSFVFFPCAHLDARENDLFDAAVGIRIDFLKDRLCGFASFGAACETHGTVRTSVVAAVFHFDKRTRVRNIISDIGRRFKEVFMILDIL